MKSPPDRCALTSENVTSSAFASLNGESLSITFRVDPVGVGDVADAPQPDVAAANIAAPSMARRIRTSGVILTAGSAPSPQPEQTAGSRSMSWVSHLLETSRGCWPSLRCQWCGSDDRSEVNDAQEAGQKTSQLRLTGRRSTE